ncbi:MAG: aminotransferase class III-fold pyridoxal phosphate-dependent enzyme, partial [Nitrospiraceae bacterium]
KMAKTYVKGEGHYLVDSEGHRVLDFISQYGAVPFGYNPPEIWDALTTARHESLPSFVQPSIPLRASELATVLSTITPGAEKITTFCSTGAEAVEAAIKLSRSTTGRRKILSTHNSFHGKTIAALSLTGRTVYQTPFHLDLADYPKVPYNDLTGLEEALDKDRGEIAAFIVEPIQGEAGIRIPSPGYLKAAESLCRSRGVLFIVDEIQTGLGRTGPLWASDSEGISPDIMLIGKALGGGLFPITACLCTEEVWNDDFGRLHSSTFANNNLACSIGITVLQILLRNSKALLKKVAASGEYMNTQCMHLHAKYPDVIQAVRGQGLLSAIEFTDISVSESFHMSYLNNIGALPPLLAGYLSNVENVRIVPFLNNHNALRLQPSLTVDIVEIDRAMSAIENVCEILYKQDYALLHDYLLSEVPLRQPPVCYRNRSRPMHFEPTPESKDGGKFAFLIHYTSPDDLVATTPAFERLSKESLDRLWTWLDGKGDIGEVCHLPSLRSTTGQRCSGSLIGIPLTTEQLLSLPRTESLPILRQGIAKARDLGARIVGLGAFTSVASRGGADLTGLGIAVTSGNSLTVAMAIEAVLKAAAFRSIPLSQCKVAVVGAAGSIGRACSLILARSVGQLVLIGRPSLSKSRLKRLTSVQADALNEWQHYRFAVPHANEADIWTSTDISDISDCDIVITATSSADQIIVPSSLKPGAIICDMARPADVSWAVAQERPDVIVIEGGLVQFPEPVAFGQNMGFVDGVNLACLSETMLLALEQDYRDMSIGVNLNMPDINFIRGLARKHGFTLGPLRSFNRELDWNSLSEGVAAA